MIFIFIAATLFLFFCALAFGEAEKIYRRYALGGVKADHRVPKKERVGLFEAMLCPPALACVVVFVVMSVVV